MTLTVTLRDLVHGTGSPDLRLLRATNPFEAPDIRVNDTEMPGSHGAVAGVDLHGMRRVPLTVQLRAATWEDALARMPDVVAAWAPGSADVELRWTDDTGDYLLFGRPRQAAPDMSNAGAGLINFDCRFAATDPFIYSAAEKLGGTLAPSPPVGFGLPLTFPLEFGDPGVGGSMQITNEGTAPAPWRALVVGPCSEPRLVGPDGAITFGGDLGAGELLELDSRARTVLLGGVSSRYALLTEFSWFSLPPGTSEVQFATADGQGGVFFAWRDTWW
jgi:hypothetical protein